MRTHESEAHKIKLVKKSEHISGSITPVPSLMNLGAPLLALATKGDTTNRLPGDSDRIILHVKSGRTSLLAH